MTQEVFKRKLTSIFSADAVGYSRLMGDDEAATVRTLTSYRNVISSLINQHNGTVIDSPGDNLLAEFVSVVDAVQCAVAVQKELKARNDELSDNRQMQFRIGINLGDVIQEGDRIYGDGVNIAARLESLAEPGGICISKTAFDHIESKLPYGYDFLGDQTVKNIAKPVGAYRVLLDPRVTVSGRPKKPKFELKKGKAIVIGAGIIIVLVIAVGVWQFFMRRPTVEPASVDNMTLPLPEKPSIVVLPFENLSGDPDKDYLIDGLTDNIITALSKIPEMFVIDQHSAFTYKGKAVKVQQVAEDLGVRYVLEGSVMLAGEQWRVNVQLIDAISGHHVWSEKYNRNMEDIFSMQDNIAFNIAFAMQVEITDGDQARMRHQTNSFKAWSLAARAHNLFESYRLDDNAKARDLFKQAVELDPNYAYAWSMLGWTHYIDGYHYPGHYNKDEAFKKASEIANRALSIDNSQGYAHLLLSLIYLSQGKYEEAEVAGKKAIRSEPNSSEVHAVFAITMQYLGDGKTVVSLIKQAMRLDPYFPDWYWSRLGVGYRMIGQYEESVAAFKRGIEIEENINRPSYQILLRLATTYSIMGREENARVLIKKAKELNPEINLELWCASQFYRDKKYTEQIREALFEAGMR